MHRSDAPASARNSRASARAAAEKAQAVLVSSCGINLPVHGTASLAWGSVGTDERGCGGALCGGRTAPCQGCEKLIVRLAHRGKSSCCANEILRGEVANVPKRCSGQRAEQLDVHLVSTCECPACVGDALRIELASAQCRHLRYGAKRSRIRLDH
eukprot:gnl/TRDRNA2_/TRDRNA2_88277_c0_seq1.p2 gnl/TRDRNA2_/TRDRNA2_88277_c0~~gnl/TRDRNA2_/TRDRNA2_88277_c0_seq1.p2  ORF type:complete len:155 (+),score=12.05 gnl/TRDRNA2_/TRDRNA2_88277_c0_seq1:266-730(+)